MNHELFEELLKEQDESAPMPWEAYENADERSLMLEALISRYNDVMDYCGESIIQAVGGISVPCIRNA